MKISVTASYGLRENPKKSLRISDDSCSTSTTLSNIICRICGKGFSTSRQLCGHLRHHTIGERLGREVVVCKECGKRFKSIRSLCGHMKSHRSVVCDGIGTIRADVIDCSLLLIPNAGVRKRARTPRFEVSRKRSHFENLEESSSALEEEVAACLIMLSQGLEFSNAALDVDGCCNAELVYKGLRSDGIESGKFLGVEITAAGSCEKISSEINFDVCKNPGESTNAEFDASRVKTEGFVGQIEMGGVCTGDSEIVKPEDGIHGVSTTGRLRYRCISCDKDFNSHQALGGHNSSKHRWRFSKTNICQTTYPVGDEVSKTPECAAGDEKMEELCAVGVTVPHCELLKSCDYKCALCFKVFRSAQALGGHMGAHVTERTMIDQTKQPRSQLRRCTSALKFDSCHTVQADNVLVAEADDVKKEETCSVGIAHFELLKKCKHKCSLCFKIFRSAQTLVEHMGAHVAESSGEPCQVQQHGSSVTELSMISKSPLASRKMIVS